MDADGSNLHCLLTGFLFSFWTLHLFFKLKDWVFLRILQSDSHCSGLMVQMQPGHVVWLCSELRGHTVHPWVSPSHGTDGSGSFGFWWWQSISPNGHKVQRCFFDTDLTTLLRRIPGGLQFTLGGVYLFSNATPQHEEETLNMEKVKFQWRQQWIWLRFLARNSDQSEVVTLKFLLSN